MPSMPTTAKILPIHIHRSPVDAQIHIPLEESVVTMAMSREHSHKALGIQKSSHKRYIGACAATSAIDALTRARIVVVDTRLLVRVDADLRLERGHGAHGHVHKGDRWDSTDVLRCQRCACRLEL